MIELIRDADRINEIANDKLVRSTMFLGMIYPQEPLDFSSALDEPGSYCLIDEKGFCAIFRWTSPETYECHIMGVKQARGANAFSSGRLMLEFMKQQGAKTVWGQPSIYNRSAICYIRRMGLKSKGMGFHPVVGQVEYFAGDI